MKITKLVLALALVLALVLDARCDARKHARRFCATRSLAQAVAARCKSVAAQGNPDTSHGRHKWR